MNRGRENWSTRERRPTMPRRRIGNPRRPCHAAAGTMFGGCTGVFLRAGLRSLRGVVLLGSVLCALPVCTADAGAMPRAPAREVEVDRLVARYEAKAASLGFPVDAFREKAREGVAKSASLSAIEKALNVRLESLRAAERILASAHPQRRDPDVARACMDVLGRALESGIPADVFDGLFDSGRRGLSLRVQAVIEAAEYLHLSDLGPEHIRAFVHDAGERDLRRMEALRAARLWVQLARDGVDEQEIRVRIWRTDTPGRRRGGGARTRMNGGRGRDGSGTGQGP